METIILFGIPAFMAYRTYKRKSEEEQETLAEYQSTRFLFTIGLFLLGALLSGMDEWIIKSIGVALILITGVIGTVAEWKATKSWRAGLLLLLVGVFAVLAFI